VPNSFRWARRVEDLTIRDARGITSELKNRTPGLSSSLPPARDFWGRGRTYQSGMGTIYDALAPAPSRVFDPEPIDRAILDNGISPRMPPHTLSFGKVPGTSLYIREHPEFYSRFLELRGQVSPSDWPGPAARPDAIVNGLPIRQLTGKEFLLRKYGDRTLLETLNDVVRGLNNQLSPQYEQGSGGPHGGKSALIHHIVSDYTRAAKGRSAEAFGQACGE